jgi:hypothetical protein
MNAADIRTINKIAERAVTLYERFGMLDDRNARFARVAIADEVLVVHREIVPLRLDEFLAADDSNFVHDISGIHRHLDYGTTRQAARLRDCFMPRFANS